MWKSPKLSPSPSPSPAFTNANSHHSHHSHHSRHSHNHSKSSNHMNELQGDDLLYACMENDVETVKKLCKLGINIEIEDIHCTTPLMLACYYGNYDVVYELINNQNVLIDHGDINDIKPLHYAVEQQHINIVKLLLHNNANIHSQTKKGQTALHYAVETSNFNIIKLLLINGSDKTIKDIYNNTPKDIANNKKIADICALLNTNDINDIKSLISPFSNNNIGGRYRTNSNYNYHGSTHGSNSIKTDKTKTIALEKERIRRGEISKIKDKVNELSFELKNKINKIEEYMNSLSISVQCIMTQSPSGGGGGGGTSGAGAGTSKYSTPASMRPQVTPISKIPPYSNITSSPLILKHVQVNNIKYSKHDDGNQSQLQQTPSTDLDGSGSVSVTGSGSVDVTPVYDIVVNNINHLDNKIIDVHAHDDDDDDVDYSFDDDDDEKTSFLGLSQIPSLRPEANSLELGTYESEYDAASSLNYHSKASTPSFLNFTNSNDLKDRIIGGATNSISNMHLHADKVGLLFNIPSTNSTPLPDDVNVNVAVPNKLNNINLQPITNKNQDINIDVTVLDISPAPHRDPILLTSRSTQSHSTRSKSPSPSPLDKKMTYQTYEYNRYNTNNISKKRSSKGRRAAMTQNHQRVQSEKISINNNDIIHNKHQDFIKQYINDNIDDHDPQMNISKSISHATTTVTSGTITDGGNTSMSDGLFPSTDNISATAKQRAYISTDDNHNIYPDLDNINKKKHIKKHPKNQKHASLHERQASQKHPKLFAADPDDEIEISEEEYSKYVHGNIIKIHPDISNKSSTTGTTTVTTLPKYQNKTKKSIANTDKRKRRILLKKSRTHTINNDNTIMNVSDNDNTIDNNNNNNQIQTKNKNKNKNKPFNKYNINVSGYNPDINNSYLLLQNNNSDKSKSSQTSSHTHIVKSPPRKLYNEQDHSRNYSYSNLQRLSNMNGNKKIKRRKKKKKTFKKTFIKSNDLTVKSVYNNNVHAQQWNK